MPRLKHKRHKWWNKLKQKYLQENPKCEWCGQDADTVHHIIPVHVNRDLEMEESNLMSLCDNRTRKCHFIVAHYCHWVKYNDKIKEITESSWRFSKYE